MKKRPPEQAIEEAREKARRHFAHGQTAEYLMGEGLLEITRHTKGRHLAQVERLMERMEQATGNVARTQLHEANPMQPWMAGAIDEINERLADVELEREFTEHKHYQVRLLYAVYVSVALRFSETLNSVADCFALGDMVGAASKAFEAGKAFGGLDRELLVKRKQRAVIAARNSEAMLPSDQVALVNLLNESLEVDFPKRHPRYREIAGRLQMKADSVRYIIEGPRRKKK